MNLVKVEFRLVELNILPGKKRGAINKHMDQFGIKIVGTRQC